LRPGASLLEFIKEAPEILDLALDERLDLLGFLGDFFCGCRTRLAENRGEVRCAASVPSQNLTNVLALA